MNVILYICRRKETYRIISQCIRFEWFWCCRFSGNFNAHAHYTHYISHMCIDGFEAIRCLNLPQAQRRNSTSKGNSTTRKIISFSYLNTIKARSSHRFSSPALFCSCYKFEVFITLVVQFCFAKALHSICDRLHICRRPLIIRCILCVIFFLNLLIWK